MFMAFDIIEEAEKAIKSLRKLRPTRKDPNRLVIELTTSQIRKFLTAVNSLKNKIDVYKINHLNEDVLSDDLVMEVKFLRVNILYQAKKNDNVKEFIAKARIEKRINEIGDSIANFNKFYKYVEALVAFHKYYGGRD